MADEAMARMTPDIDDRHRGTREGWRRFQWGALVLVALALGALGSGCWAHDQAAPRVPSEQGPVDHAGALAPGDQEPFGEEPPLEEDSVEFIVESPTMPDWAALGTGIRIYRGVPAIVGRGVAEGTGEPAMVRLVARRKARGAIYGVITRIARYLGKKVGMSRDAIELLDTQLQGFVDVLLPDHRRFVPTWRDPGTNKVYSAVLIPLDRFLAMIRDSWNVPDELRGYLGDGKKYARVRRELIERFE